MRNLVGATVLMFAIGASGAALAQGVVPGAAEGAREGGAVAGPPGAVVGGVVGGVAGGVGAILGVDERPRFRTYAVGRRHPSYHYRERVVVGAELPDTGVEYYEIPVEYGPRVREYRYTIVNDEPVIVDRRTRRIVEVID
jgi:hypothetical protein